ncbi:MFS transporter [Entomospira nematocerorum]|uniref:Multidrug efflux MFS transporter n=1 Tax=Entomospira nematocerorum TaxID=2719987 RepID=A0A968GEE8_9SPIO|nr:MFS transporter [Entomospira nematocera]NIZ46765.1 multidrug efflux MFS transporter [Entomospira nematocera]WDI33438.1 MFS transporter [Entomospira nematocera]
MNIIYHSKKVNWKIIVATILFSEMLTIAAFTITVPILPLILKDFFDLEGQELTKWTGFLGAGPSFAMMILMPVWGILADKYGKRLMLLRALVTGIIIIGLMSFVQTPLQLLVLQTLQGGFTGSIAAATVLVLYYTPKSHTISILALLQVAIFLGKSIGPFLGGSVYDTFGGRWNFPITSLILLVSLILLIIVVPKDKPSPKDISQPMINNGVRKGLHPFLLFLMSMTFSIAIAFSLVNSIFVIYVKNIVSEIPELLGNLGRINGMIMSISNLAMAAGALLFSRLAKYIKMEKMLIFAVIGTAIFYLPQIYAPNWQVILVIRSMESFFVGGITPALQYFISRYAEKERQGAIFGLNRSLDGLGLTFGPLIGVMIVNSHEGSFQPVFILGSFLLVLIALIFMIVSSQEKRRSPGLICACQSS